MPHICVKGQALERALEECLSAYCDRFPDHWEALLEMIRKEEATLIKPSGLSADGTMMTYCKLPEHLYAGIKRTLRRHLGIDDVFRDPATYRILIRLAQGLHIRKHGTKSLRVALPT